MKVMEMKIAILGWGSLVWDSRDLPLQSAWMTGGPTLPLEFSRVSKDGRLTLVIDLVHGAQVPSRYAVSSRKDLGDAIADLRDREGSVRKRIGFVDVNSGITSKTEFPEHADVFDSMSEWCKINHFDAVVWTALPSQFDTETGKPFSVDNAIEYLLSLPKTARDTAFEYIKNAPEEVVTPVRNKVRELKLF